MKVSESDMNNIKYPIAFDSKGSIIRADDPDIQIRRSSKTCCGCGKPMHYVDGFVRHCNTFVSPHFRHSHNNPNCTVDNAIIAGESIYHADFKKLLFDEIKRHTENRLPLYIELICGECRGVYNRNLLRQDIHTEIEYQNGDYRPDIALIDVNNKVYTVLEIVVSHSPEFDYLNFLESNNIKLLKFELNIEKPFDYWVYKYIGNDSILRPSSISFVDFDFCNKPRCKTCGSHLRDAVMSIFNRGCWYCGRYYLHSVIYHHDNEYGVVCTGPEDFTLDEIEFARSKGVIIEWRYSQTIRDYYYAMVCPFCNRIRGQFFLHNDFGEDCVDYMHMHGGRDDDYIDYICHDDLTFPITICTKHCGGPKPYQNDTYSHNSLDIRKIDNFVDYSDTKKILEKQRVNIEHNFE